MPGPIGSTVPGGALADGERYAAPAAMAGPLTLFARGMPAPLSGSGHALAASLCHLSGEGKLLAVAGRC
jgi:hypothetical protein